MSVTDKSMPDSHPPQNVSLNPLAVFRSFLVDVIRALKSGLMLPQYYCQSAMNWMTNQPKARNAPTPVKMAIPSQDQVPRQIPPESKFAMFKDTFNTLLRFLRRDETDQMPECDRDFQTMESHQGSSHGKWTYPNIYDLGHSLVNFPVQFGVDISKCFQTAIFGLFYPLTTLKCVGKEIITFSIQFGRNVCFSVECGFKGLFHHLVHPNPMWLLKSLFQSKSVRNVDKEEIIEISGKSENIPKIQRLETVSKRGEQALKTSEKEPEATRNISDIKGLEVKTFEDSSTELEKQFDVKSSFRAMFNFTVTFFSDLGTCLGIAIGAILFVPKNILMGFLNLFVSTKADSMQSDIKLPPTRGVKPHKHDDVEQSISEMRVPISKMKPAVEAISSEQNVECETRYEPVNDEDVVEYRASDKEYITKLKILPVNFWRDIFKAFNEGFQFILMLSKIPLKINFKQIILFPIDFVSDVKKSLREAFNLTKLPILLWQKIKSITFNKTVWREYFCNKVYKFGNQFAKDQFQALKTSVGFFIYYLLYPYPGHCIAKFKIFLNEHEVAKLAFVAGIRFGTFALLGTFTVVKTVVMLIIKPFTPQMENGEETKTISSVKNPKSGHTQAEKHKTGKEEDESMDKLIELMKQVPREEMVNVKSMIKSEQPHQKLQKLKLEVKDTEDDALFVEQFLVSENDERISQDPKSKTLAKKPKAEEQNDEGMDKLMELLKQVPSEEIVQKLQNLQLEVKDTEYDAFKVEQLLVSEKEEQILQNPKIKTLTKKPKAEEQNDDTMDKLMELLKQVPSEEMVKVISMINPEQPQQRLQRLQLEVEGTESDALKVEQVSEISKDKSESVQQFEVENLPTEHELGARPKKPSRLKSGKSPAEATKGANNLQADLEVPEVKKHVEQTKMVSTIDQGENDQLEWLRTVSEKLQVACQETPEVAPVQTSTSSEQKAQVNNQVEALKILSDRLQETLADSEPKLLTSQLEGSENVPDITSMLQDLNEVQKANLAEILPLEIEEMKMLSNQRKLQGKGEVNEIELLKSISDRLVEVTCKGSESEPFPHEKINIECTNEMDMKEVEKMAKQSLDNDLAEITAVLQNMNEEKKARRLKEIPPLEIKVMKMLANKATLHDRAEDKDEENQLELLKMISDRLEKTCGGIESESIPHEDRNLESNERTNTKDVSRSAKCILDDEFKVQAEVEPLKDSSQRLKPPSRGTESESPSITEKSIEEISAMILNMDEEEKIKLMEVVFGVKQEQLFTVDPFNVTQVELSKDDKDPITESSKSSQQKPENRIKSKQQMKDEENIFQADETDLIMSPDNKATEMSHPLAKSELEVQSGIGTDPSEILKHMKEEDKFKLLKMLNLEMQAAPGVEGEIVSHVATRPKDKQSEDDQIEALESISDQLQAGSQPKSSQNVTQIDTTATNIDNEHVVLAERMKLQVEEDINPDLRAEHIPIKRSADVSEPQQVSKGFFQSMAEIIGIKSADESKTLSPTEVQMQEKIMSEIGHQHEGLPQDELAQVITELVKQEIGKHQQSTQDAPIESHHPVIEDESISQDKKAVALQTIGTQYEQMQEEEKAAFVLSPEVFAVRRGKTGIWEEDFGSAKDHQIVTPLKMAPKYQLDDALNFSSETEVIPRVVQRPFEEDFSHLRGYEGDNDRYSDLELASDYDDDEVDRDEDDELLRRIDERLQKIELRPRASRDFEEDFSPISVRRKVS